ncbi:hypothetical protein [Chitinophaga pinensis]|uniref:Uncharacterized protein n=1 Tax=Chitinophaga pinensis (strain ATCC 43595 / DSM 2588 / LMG 13176 / NBRC 15968 / NCIMB 11800 / UQM 2034) TaxID=485918 RepID=A0A979G5F7_CHIPD|nr:hypothetical protein [Chitinophaga pinensis]ACU61045.1 hypothetical protein Cpin_3582 [Chitinophaga pinensis DSM 2588]
MEDVHQQLKKANRVSVLLLIMAVIICIVAMELYSYSHWWALLPYCLVFVPVYLLKRYKAVVLLPAENNWFLVLGSAIPFISWWYEESLTNDIKIADGPVLARALWFILLFLLLIWYCSRGLNLKSGRFLATTVFMTFVFTMNTVNLIRFVNVRTDLSKSDYKEAVVVGKYKENLSKQPIHYYLSLRGMNDRSPGDVSVNKEVYLSVKKMDTMMFCFYKGALGIPWHTVAPVKQVPATEGTIE